MPCSTLALLLRVLDAVNLLGSGVARTCESETLYNLSCLPSATANQLSPSAVASIAIYGRTAVLNICLIIVALLA